MAPHSEGHEDWTTRLYRAVMAPLIRSAWKRWAFLVGVVVLLVAFASLVYFGFVQVKLLRFDNKSEFQVIVDCRRAPRYVAPSPR